MRKQQSQDCQDANQLVKKNLSLDMSSMIVSCSDTNRSVQLAKKEYHMLEYLMRNYGHVLSRDQITVRVWGYDSEAEYNNVDVYISYLRKKLMFIGTTVQIVSVRGVGYKLETENAER